jgi:hypothetical protein
MLVPYIIRLDVIGNTKNQVSVLSLGVHCVNLRPCSVVFHIRTAVIIDYFVTVCCINFSDSLSIFVSDVKQWLGVDSCHMIDKMWHFFLEGHHHSRKKSHVVLIMWFSNYGLNCRQHSCNSISIIMHSTVFELLKTSDCQCAFIFVRFYIYGCIKCQCLLIKWQ